MRQTVPDRLGELARRGPGEAVVTFHTVGDSRVVLTRNEFQQRVESVAGQLTAAWETKVGRPPAVGDFLAILLSNRIEQVVCGHAAWRLGVTPVPVNLRAPEPEREAFLRLVEPSVVVAETSVASWPTVTLAELGDPLLSSLPPARGSDPAFGIGSGGSTGRPKLILGGGPLELDPEALTRTYASFGFGPEDRTFIAAPLYHAAGFVDSMMALFLGQQLVMMERFDAAGALRLLEEEGIESAVFVPTMLKRMLECEDLAGTDLSALRALCHLGAKCPASVKRDWIELLGAERVYEIYGSTEATGLTAIRGDEWLAHPGSVGRPVDSRLLIAGPDGAELGPGEVGEIFMAPAAGPVSFDYRGDAPRLRDDGLASVGDLGWVDEDGYLYIADRRSDLIVSGGSNVFPAEVESTLCGHPEILDAAVIGLPDEEWGQVVHAVIVPKPGTALTDAAVRDFCRERLVPYKVPKSVELVERLPRNEVGKLRRRALIDERIGSVAG